MYVDGPISVVVYTDFEKAFDKVPNKRLLSKLKAYKLHNTIIQWIKTFLTDRKQRVRVNGKFSCWAKVLSGIHTTKFDIRPASVYNIYK